MAGCRPGWLHMAFTPLCPCGTSPPQGGRLVEGLTPNQNGFSRNSDSAFAVQGGRSLQSPPLRGRCPRMRTEGGERPYATDLGHFAGAFILPVQHSFTCLWPANAAMVSPFGHFANVKTTGRLKYQFPSPGGSRRERWRTGRATTGRVRMTPHTLNGCRLAHGGRLLSSTFKKRPSANCASQTGDQFTVLAARTTETTKG